MLDAGRAPEQRGGLILFFDHADNDLRYVVPEAPRIVRQPEEPQLSLVIYRDDDRGGGLLQLESTLAPTAAQLAAARADLVASGLTPILHRPDWRSGTVRIAGWLAEEELAPIALASGPPSLIGDPRVVLAAHLDAAGAALADAALRGNALPTVLIFELATLGLSGPLGIEVEADLQAVHDRLTAEGALTTPYGRARLAKTWEELARENLIRVEVVDESGEVESRREEALRRVGEDLVARMFSPFPPPESAQQLDDETVAAIELSFRLTMRREEVATTSRWSFTERRAVAIKHYAAASLVDLLGDSAPAAHIHTVDLQVETHQLVVRVEPELSALGIASVEVDLSRHGGEVERTVALTDEAGEERLTLTHLAMTHPTMTHSGAGPLMYRVRARFDPESTRAADRESDWIEALGDVVVVSARRLFPPRTFTAIAGRAELDWLDHVEVVVAAPAERERSLLLTATTRSADLYLPAAGSGPLTVTTHWRGLPGEPMRSDPPRQVDEDLLILDSPFGDSIRVLVAPLPLPDAMTLDVELVHEHEGFRHAKTLSWEGSGREPKRAGLRRLAGSPRSYTYRVVIVRQDGSLDESAWVETDKVALAVGANGPVRVHEIAVALLGGGPDGRGSFAVELVLAAGDHQARKVVEGEVDHVRLVLVAPEDAPPPELLVREFLMTGPVRETRLVAPASLVVLPPAAVEET